MNNAQQKAVDEMIAKELSRKAQKEEEAKKIIKQESTQMRIDKFVKSSQK